MADSRSQWNRIRFKADSHVLANWRLVISFPLQMLNGVNQIQIDSTDQKLEKQWLFDGQLDTELVNVMREF